MDDAIRPLTAEELESQRLAADLALDQNKAERAHAENDARALRDQIMLQTMLRSSM